MEKELTFNPEGERVPETFSELVQEKIYNGPFAKSMAELKKKNPDASFEIDAAMRHLKSALDEIETAAPELFKGKE